MGLHICSWPPPLFVLHEGEDPRINHHCPPAPWECSSPLLPRQLPGKRGRIFLIFVFPNPLRGRCSTNFRQSQKERVAGRIREENWSYIGGKQVEWWNQRTEVRENGGMGGQRRVVARFGPALPWGRCARGRSADRPDGKTPYHPRPNQTLQRKRFPSLRPGPWSAAAAAGAPTGPQPRGSPSASPFSFPVTAA